MSSEAYFFRRKWKNFSKSPRNWLIFRYIEVQEEGNRYLADQLFIKHQVRVHFREEYVRDGSPYRVIFCHVRKRDQERFLAALNELPGKMMLLGYTDYLDACHAIWGNRKSHNEKEVTDCDAVRTTEQA